MKKIVYFILDTKISEESVFRQVYSSTCSTKELSITMTKIMHTVKGRLLSLWQSIFAWKHQSIAPHRWRNVSRARFECVDRGLEAGSGQTKDYKIGICCFSAKHTALRRKSKDWLARNQNNFCSSLDGIWTHTIDTLQHHSLSLTSSALDHWTTSTP